MHAGISTFLQFLISSAKIKYVSVKAIYAELSTVSYGDRDRFPLKMALAYP
jgi:hypothetical protein